MRKHGPLRRCTLYAFCAVIVAAVLIFAVGFLASGADQAYLPETPTLNLVMLIAEFGITALVVGFAVRYKKYYVALLSLAQTGLMAWLELSGRAEIPGDHIVVDRLTVIMCLIIGVVGCLICVYAVGYMKDYDAHHGEVKDRRAFFFAMLFVFLGAMFGLVFSSSLIWIYFFWEITSICSFLLIGYSKTEEAIRNSFKALWMNLLGGLGFAVAIVYSATQLHVIQLEALVESGVGTKAALIPVALLAFAALTKSAQLPFSGWLLGAMVAPTPTSALLHSATMVKAGVYLLLRLSPAFAGNAAGIMVTAVGGFTFLAASMLAISQSDGKKVLAYSTVSNLGLITACAGVGAHEAVWAGILLMIFHAVSKSLMFLSVGAVENSTGSRNIEDMHGLIVRLPYLAFVMIVGIAGMFLAPFGMLISKWAALKAFVDADNIALVIFLIFGSATTLFYWTKWLGTLSSVSHQSHRQPNTVKGSEWFSLLIHAVTMIALVLAFPLVSAYLIEPFLVGMFHDNIPQVISSGNMFIMMLMLCAIAILPIVLRALTFGGKDKIVMSYMGGANAGDDRSFINSFGAVKPMYLANWYMGDYFGEKKIYKPAVAFATLILVVLMLVAIGGAL